MMEMIPEDRRFMAYWKDQRQGSRAGYYAIYTLGWGAVIFFILFFLAKIFTNLWETGGPYLAIIFIAIALILSFLVTHYTWKKNEKRLHALMQKEAERLN